MTIYGVRIYPQSLRVVQGAGAPILLHGRISEEVSDFFTIFGPLAQLWRQDFFVQGFGIEYDFDQNGQLALVDPLPGLRKYYGEDLVNADVESQLVVTRGSGFADWGREAHYQEGAFLPVFVEVPSFGELKRLFWQRDFTLSCDTWPAQMKFVLQMWDDIYWQFFSRDKADIDLLIETHRADARLKLFWVDFDREYPDPSNGELRAAS